MSNKNKYFTIIIYSWHHFQLTSNQDLQHDRKISLSNRPTINVPNYIPAALGYDILRCLDQEHTLKPNKNDKMKERLVISYQNSPYEE